jgi:hypothetical protein
MMRILFPHGTTFFYKMMWALLPPNAVLYVWMTLDYLTHPLASGMYGPAELAAPPMRALFTLVAAPLLITIGLLIMRRAPGNVVGVLVTILGLSIPTFEVGPHSGTLLPSLQGFMIPIWYAALIYMVIFFPDGRAPWGRAEGFFTAIMAYFIVWSAMLGFTLPQENTYGAPVYNAFYVPALTPAYELLGQGFVLIMPLLIAAVFLSPALRYRATQPGSRERQQIRWLAFCATLFALFLVVYSIFVVTGSAVNAPERRVFQVVYQVFLAMFPPLALGFAILRHNLYDIDLIIRRTLVYAVLTTLLAAIYFGGVALAQALLRPFTGAGNDLAVVVTTLGIAALALPLRREVQGFIDRRFYRRKYNAARTLATFSAEARDEVELEALTSRLVAVVDETMQPAQVSLWLRADSARRAGG